MDRMQKAVLILNLIDRLKGSKSWCGKTHIQKTTYFLQEMLKAPLGFSFVMYKYGPFSFDLRDELTSLRADNLLSIQLMSPYGPSFITTELGKKIQEAFPNTLRLHREKIEFVARKLRIKNVAELERLATALYIALKLDDATHAESRIAEEMRRLKPHISESDSLNAVREFTKIRQEASAAF